MRRPTERELERAAVMLLRIAFIPGLDSGVVTLPADDLSRCRWHDHRPDERNLDEVLVVIPSDLDGRDALGACRAAVRSALKERQRELELLAERFLAARSYAALKHIESLFYEAGTRQAAGTAKP